MKYTNIVTHADHVGTPPYVGPDRPDTFIDYFHVHVYLWAVGQHCTGNFLCNVGEARSREHFVGNSPAERRLCVMSQHCTSNFLTQCCFTTYLDNFDQTIFLCNAKSLSDHITQGFYLSHGCPKSIKKTLNRIFLCNVVPGDALWTKLHRLKKLELSKRPQTTLHK